MKIELTSPANCSVIILKIKTFKLAYSIATCIHYVTKNLHEPALRTNVCLYMALQQPQWKNKPARKAFGDITGIAC